MYATQFSRSLLRRQLTSSSPLSLLRSCQSTRAAPSTASFHATVRQGNLSTLKELRAVSGAPMMECKKALEASDNDTEKALDWLRQHGAAKASSKVAGRETVEGLIGVASSEDDKSLSIVQVASETDFAGRSDTFVQLVQDVTTSVLSQEEFTNSSLSTEQLHGLPGKGDSGVASVKDLMDNAIVAIRENLSIPSATKYVTNDPQNIWVPYVHNKVPGTETGTTVSAVLIGPSTNSTVDSEALRAIGKRLAMHIVAARPQYLGREDVPEDAVEKERSVLQGQIELDNKAGKAKPPEIIEKMIQGRLRKFFEQVCLKEQAHMIEEGNPKVSKALLEDGVDLHQFVYLAIGNA